MLKPLDLSLYLVTDTGQCGELGVAQTVRQAVEAGVGIVQLRDPDATDDEFVALGRELVRALEPTGVPLIVNDRVHTVAAIGAQGAHVGQDDLDIATARRDLGPGALLGLSADTVGHLEAAEELTVEAGRALLDYVGVGAFRATATKADHPPPGGLDLLATMARRSVWPAVAIGGITVADLPAIRGTGVAGVAVVSAICGQPDVRAATAALRQAWDEATPLAAQAPQR